MVKKLLSNLHIGDHALIEDLQRPTTIKTRVISKNHHIVRVDEEDITPTDVRLLKDLRLPLKVDAVIISDYNKGFLIPELVQKIIKEYKGKCPIIVDPKKNVEMYKGVDIIKPNDKELNEIMVKYKTIIDMIHALGLKYLVGTMGEKGLMLVDSDNQYTYYPVYNPNIIKVDITGAGDTFIGTMATALATGYDIKEAVSMANFASGLTIQHMGCYAPKLEEFKDYHGTPTETDRKQDS